MMRVSEAISLIKDILAYEAKKEIVDKFSADESMIQDKFKYIKEGKVEYISPLSVVDDSAIKRELYLNMLSMCVLAAPLKLLVPKGSSHTIIRALNDDYDIRKPNDLSSGEEIDIDESLAQGAVYFSLSEFGLSAYRSKAKDLLDEYNDNLILPKLNSPSVAFRFSKNGTSYKSNFETGDKFMAIFQNGNWSENIPLGSG